MSALGNFYGQHAVDQVCRAKDEDSETLQMEESSLVTALDSALGKQLVERDKLNTVMGLIKAIAKKSADNAAYSQLAKKNSGFFVACFRDAGEPTHLAGAAQQEVDQAASALRTGGSAAKILADSLVDKLLETFTRIASNSVQQYLGGKQKMKASQLKVDHALAKMTAEKIEVIMHFDREVKVGDAVHSRDTGKETINCPAGVTCQDQFETTESWSQTVTTGIIGTTKTTSGVTVKSVGVPHVDITAAITREATTQSSESTSEVMGKSTKKTRTFTLEPGGKYVFVKSTTTQKWKVPYQARIFMKGDTTPKEVDDEWTYEEVTTNQEIQKSAAT
eukprot:TRINITY_DN39456_c0_g1_i1.p1 TRINITY_DN39456_c0_g1~~TRINITY_DN39456_c0_g1_i1.p1  ORF type:complete len:390 (+),score=58.18 TRINITY_DN39456_c0_g1_i1:171-1172(+)